MSLIKVLMKLLQICQTHLTGQQQCRLSLSCKNFPPTEINIMVILALLSLKNYLMVVQYKSVAHLPMLNKPTMEHFICCAVNNKLNNGH